MRSRTKRATFIFNPTRIQTNPASRHRIGCLKQLWLDNVKISPIWTYTVVLKGPSLNCCNVLVLLLHVCMFLCVSKDRVEKYSKSKCINHNIQKGSAQFLYDDYNRLWSVYKLNWIMNMNRLWKQIDTIVIHIISHQKSQIPSQSKSGYQKHLPTKSKTEHL